MTSETRTEKVYMTLAEVADLIEKGKSLLCRTGVGYCAGYSFDCRLDPKGLHEISTEIPNLLGELDQTRLFSGKLRQMGLNITGLTSGELYLARRVGDKFEVKPVSNLYERDCVNLNSLNINKSAILRFDSVGKKSYFQSAYGCLPMLGSIDVQKVAEHEHGEIIVLPGRATFEEMTSLPIWETPKDFESILSAINQRTKDSCFDYSKRKYFSVDDYVEEDWSFVTPTIPLYNSFLNTPLFWKLKKEAVSGVNPGPEGIGIIVEIDSIPDGITIEGELLNDYVQPSISTEGGVVVMNYEKMPIFLRRRLGVVEPKPIEPWRQNEVLSRNIDLAEEIRRLKYENRILKRTAGDHSLIKILKGQRSRLKCGNQ